MSVDRAEVERIAALARLRFDRRETDRLTIELNQILDHIEVLRSLPEGGGTVSSHGAAQPPSMRASEAEEPDVSGGGIERFAPRSEEGFFVVPPPPGVRAGDEA